jgi:hypothetical protein
MKYTKDDLAKMSGFEISKELCILRGIVVAHEQYMNYSDRDEDVVLLEGDDSFNFKNWNDIMPLAVENGVYHCNGTAFQTIQDYIDGRTIFNEPCFFAPSSPQRAIACCLILVLQERE